MKRALGWVAVAGVGLLFALTWNFIMDLVEIQTETLKVLRKHKEMIIYIDERLDDVEKRLEGHTEKRYVRWRRRDIDNRQAREDGQP